MLMCLFTYVFINVKERVSGNIIECLIMRIAENLMIQVPPNDSRSLMLQFYGSFSTFKVAMK